MWLGGGASGFGLMYTLCMWGSREEHHQKPLYTFVQNSNIDSERGPQATTQDDTVRPDDDQDQEK
jgi:hypothetical protein